MSKYSITTWYCRHDTCSDARDAIATIDALWWSTFPERDVCSAAWAEYWRIRAASWGDTRTPEEQRAYLDPRRSGYRAILDACPTKGRR